MYCLENDDVCMLRYECGMQKQKCPVTEGWEANDHQNQMNGSSFRNHIFPSLPLPHSLHDGAHDDDGGGRQK